MAGVIPALALFLVINRLIRTRPTKKMDLLFVLLTGFFDLVAVGFIRVER